MKKIVTIFFIISLVSYLVYLYKKNMKTSLVKNFTPEDAEKAILVIKEKYGADMAKVVEKIMRLETAHFTSKQYKQTGSAGMEAGKWANLPSNVNTIPMYDNHDGHIGKFIVWDSVTDFAIYLAEYIKRHNGDFLRWNSTDETKKLAYKQKLNSIKNRIV